MLFRFSFALRSSRQMTALIVPDKQTFEDNTKSCNFTATQLAFPHVLCEAGAACSALHILRGKFIPRRNFMGRSSLRFRGNFLATCASMLMAGALGCASHLESSSSVSSVPASPIAPSASSVRDLGDLTSRSIMPAGAVADSASVPEKTLTGGATARGFDFGDNGGGNGGSASVPLTFDSLGQLLTSLGSRPEVHNKAYVYNIKEDSGLTYPLVISLSEDGRAVYYLIPMFNVEPQGWANQEALLKLLVANSGICPAAFGIVDQRLFLMLGIPNSNVTPDLMKECISFVLDTMHKSQALWGPWMPSGNQGGSGDQGGNNSGGNNSGGGNGGNSGGGNTGGGNSGGGSNPFGQ
jgi:hypothetical protein